MSLYSIDAQTSEIVMEDGSRFQQDDSLAAYQTYLAWLQLGNSPEIINAANSPNGVRITKLSFRNRFTQAEKVTIDMASLDNPAASMQLRQYAAALRVYMKDLENATYIDLSLEQTITGVNLLEQFGLIAAGRADEILNTAPTLVEEWRG